MSTMTNEEIQDYVERFYYHQRNEIYKMVLDSRKLEDAFKTNGGAAVFQGAVETIARDVMKIVDICASETAEAASQKVYPVAIAIDAMHRTILNWAATIAKGKEYEQRAENQG